MRQFANRCLLSIALATASAGAMSGDLKTLPDVAIHASANRNESSPATLLTVKPSGNWVLLVPNSRLSGSEAYLSSLKADGFDGDKLVVLLLSDAELAQSWAAREVLPSKARLASSEVYQVLAGLNLPRTPAFFDITAEGKIAWQRLGYGKKPGERLVQMWDWVKRPIPPASRISVGQ